MEKKITQQIKVYPTDINTPISLYLKFIGKDKGILLESAEVDGRLGRYSLLAWDFQFYLKCKNGKMETHIKNSSFEFLKRFNGMDYFLALKKIIQIIKPEQKEYLLPAITRSLIGYIGYECICMFEPVLQRHISLENAESVFVFPGKQILYDHLHHKCFYLTIDESKLEETKTKINNNVEVGEIKKSFY